MSSKTSVKPVIQNGHIVRLEVEDISLPLREQLALEELPQLITAVEGFFKYVDVEKLSDTLVEMEEGISEWEEKDLRKFVLTQLRDSQATALRLLVGHVLSRQEFIERMKTLLEDDKFRGWSLGGLLAGITMKAKGWGYESPYESEWRTVGDAWKCFYYITKKKYEPIIRDALKARDS